MSDIVQFVYPPVPAAIHSMYPPVPLLNANTCPFVGLLGEAVVPNIKAELVVLFPFLIVTCVSVKIASFVATVCNVGVSVLRVIVVPDTAEIVLK